MTYDRVIGNGNKLPWHISDELKFFKEITVGKTLIMGANTIRSIGKTLPLRKHIILSSKPKTEFEKYGDVKVCHHIDSAILTAQSWGTEVCVVGGLSVYEQFLNDGICDYLTISWIKKNYDGDVVFPRISQYPYRAETILKETSEFITMRYIKNDNNYRS